MLKKLLLYIACTLSLFFAAPAMAVAVDCTQGSLSPQDALQCGTSGASGNQSKSPAQATTSFNNLIRDLLVIMSVIAAILAVVMIVIAGIRFVTSGGNAESIKSAKTTLMYAIIGIIIAALAQIIVNFVLHKTITSTQ